MVEAEEKDVIGYGYTFKSTWEYSVAVYLTENNFIWKYEVETFNIDESSSYNPDFFIYDCNDNLIKIIEVKGYFWKRNLDKFNAFKGLYPEIKIELWDKITLKDMKLI